LNTVNFQAHIVVNKVLVTRLARNNDHGSLNGREHLLSTSSPTC
jgi:hypothetical protein